MTGPAQGPCLHWIHEEPAIQTVTITGASGFIAKHIVLKALERGHAVRAGLRSPARADEVRAAVAPHLPAGAMGRLSFVTLDLERDEGWDAAMAGADALIHTASPFPLVQPKDEADLIRPAVEGTRRALGAAARAGVARAVVTSSIAAVSAADLPPGREAYDETIWTDPAHRTASAYVRSKTLAERAAWEIAAATPGLALTAINPGLVAGPPLDARYGTSLRVIARILAAKDPAVPPVAFGVVDVRDVAEAHLRALERPAAAGARILTVAGTLWFREMAQAIAAALPGRRVVTREAPGWFLRILARFDPSVATILPMLHRYERFDTTRARTVLGLDFIPAPEAVAAAARALAALRA